MNTTTNQIDAAEKEAVVLNSFANALLKAAESNNQHEKLLAIDHNLKLWVEIETSLKSAKNLLPEEVKKNLFKLADFVKYMTMSKGINMSKEDFKNLANINNQISLGIQESVKNNLAAEEAFSLLKCAMDLSRAKEKSNAGELAKALDNNMQLCKMRDYERYSYDAAINMREILTAARLTDLQNRIVKMRLRGYSVKKIARKLQRQRATIYAHLNAIGVKILPILAERGTIVLYPERLCR